MEFVTLPCHLTFQILQQLLLQRRLIHNVAEITLAIKGIIHSFMKKSQHADHVIIKICKTCTANEDSPSIYTRWKIDEEKDQDFSQNTDTTNTSLQGSTTIKKNGQTLKIHRILLLKPLSHYNLRLP